MSLMEDSVALDLRMLDAKDSPMQPGVCAPSTLSANVLLEKGGRTSKPSVARQNAEALLEQARFQGLRITLPTCMNDRYDRPVGSKTASCISSYMPIRPERSTIASGGDVENAAIWLEHKTPDGFPYFTSSDGRFVTDTHNSHTELFSKILRWENTIRYLIEAIVGLDPNWEVLIRALDDGSCLYYIINYNLESVSWLHTVNSLEEFGVDDCTPQSRIELFLQTEFWAHVELFPRRMPANAALNTKEMLLYARIDAATAPGSTSPFSTDQCSLFLDTLAGLSESSDTSSVKVHVVGRLNHRFYRNRFLTNFGEDGARLDRSQSSVTARPARTSQSVQLFFRVLHWVFFGLETSQLLKIREVIVDDIVLPRLWHSFLTEFVRSIEQTSIVAALISAANIGFLTINGLTQFQSAASLISTFLSLSSLLLGLYHVRYHNGFVTMDGSTGANYFGNADYIWAGWGGYRLLAVLHSLPLALLVWSVLIFGVTVIMHAQQTLNLWSWDIFGTATVLLILLPSFTLWFFCSLSRPI